MTGVWAAMGARLTGLARLRGHKAWAVMVAPLTGKVIPPPRGGGELARSPRA
ncbi:MAG: hypothetical protein AAF982_08005 [Pseudomonadota bacterium]